MNILHFLSLLAFLISCAPEFKEVSSKVPTTATSSSYESQRQPISEIHPYIDQFAKTHFDFILPDSDFKLTSMIEKYSVVLESRFESMVLINEVTKNLQELQNLGDQFSYEFMTVYGQPEGYAREFTLKEICSSRLIPYIELEGNEIKLYSRKHFKYDDKEDCQALLSNHQLSFEDVRIYSEYLISKRMLGIWIGSFLSKKAKKELWEMKMVAASSRMPETWHVPHMETFRKLLRLNLQFQSSLSKYQLLNIKEKRLTYQYENRQEISALCQQGMVELQNYDLGDDKDINILKETMIHYMKSLDALVMNQH